MTHDPLEGVDPEGFITTGASLAHVPAAYKILLNSTISAISNAFGEHLHSAYLYGSVATGCATVPTSDLDLLVVCYASIPPQALTTFERLVGHPSIVRSVGLATMTLNELASSHPDAPANEAFLKHYCVHLLGADLARALPKSQPSPDLARAFNFDVPPAVESFRTLLSQSSDGDVTDLAEPAHVLSRRILLTIATTLSTRFGSWSTSRDLAARLVHNHYPRLAPAADLALSWSASPPITPTFSDLRTLLELADWAAQECPLLLPAPAHTPLSTPSVPPTA